MNLLPGEPEEPPSCPTATTSLLTKPHNRINSHSPVTAQSLGALTARLERFPIGPLTRAFRKRYFPEVELAEWNDWRWQARRRIRTLAELERIFVLSEDERDAVEPPPRLAAGRHHALLREPDEPRRCARAAPPHPHPGRHRICEDAGRGRRPARRGRPQRRARPRAPLSRPRAVPGHRLLLDLLPLLHALAHGGRARRRLFLQPAAMGAGARLYRRAPGDPRRADLGRRPAHFVGRAARLSARAPARDQARRVRPHRHQGAGRAAAAHHALAHPDAEEASSAVDEPALHPSRRAHARGHARPAPGSPTPAFRSAPRRCCSRASTTTSTR